MRKHLLFFFLGIIGGFRRLFLQSSEEGYKLLFIPGYEKARWKIGEWKAWRVFEHAKNDVPAYSKFLKQHHFIDVRVDGLTPRLSDIPATDKESYVKKFSIESRCVGGEIPAAGVVIDESSGTSGTPNNWVRGVKERRAVKYALQTALHALIDKKKIFFINAFALGPWATGMNVSMSLVDVAIMKSTGPDLAKIENTLNTFGPSYTYIIAGYPPFLKGLVDSQNVKWSKFTIFGFFGGEGMGEGMRSYLGKVFKKMYGSYGASDLEINIAAENDFTIGLRRLLLKDRALYADIVKHGTLPMIFQYNPLDYYIESNAEGELLVTLCRLSNVAPKVRYNIHDLGHVIRMPELETILKKHGWSLADCGGSALDLPVLFHYGRSDASVGFYGCKITPTDLENVMFKVPAFTEKVNSFSLITSEDEAMNKRLVVALEMKEGTEPFVNTDEMEKTLYETLTQVNQDFRESLKMVPAGFQPTMEVYAFGTGPFAVNDIRLKKHYIQQR